MPENDPPEQGEDFTPLTWREVLRSVAKGVAWRLVFAAAALLLLHCLNH